MNKFWRIIEVLDRFWHNVVIFFFSLFMSIVVFGLDGFALTPDKDQVIAILTVIGLAIAYSSFFVSNIDKISTKDNREPILNLSKALIISPSFLIFLLLFINSGVNFQNFNIAVALVMVVFSLASVTAFFFCLIKLLYILAIGIFFVDKKNKSNYKKI